MICLTPAVGILKGRCFALLHSNSSLNLEQLRKTIMSLYTDSESAQIGITAMFTILVPANLLGNTIVCLVIIIYQEMR